MRFRRTAKDAAPADTGAPAVIDLTKDERAPKAVTAPKGRATPKRAEARSGKGGALPAPKDRKEATARNRAARREIIAKQRLALQTGDEANLPPRDKGPDRALARDLVDARRSLASLFFAVALLLLVGTFIRNAPIVSLVTLLLSLVVLGDGILAANVIKRKVRSRHPGARGIAMYAFQRVLAPRRFRLPKPRVATGARVKI